ncbi:MAG TPA: tetratricopeptide repeat protein [Opitutaceae bacterium]|nr:tetratricopeptide repeat protein [Opitutaceae bacterium]
MFPKISVLLPPVLMLALMPVRGAGQPGATVPLAPAGPAPVAPADAVRTLEAAQRAQELGLPSVAADQYRQLLALPPGTGGDRVQITLALSTALMDADDIAGADETLHTLPEAQRNSVWHLRAGLLAAYQKKVDVASAELALVKPEELAPADVGWWYFLYGMLANIAGEGSRALDFYGRAAAAATSEMARARFLLAEDQARLRLGTVTDKNLDDARKTADEHPGMSIGYGNVRAYAMMLDVANRKADAIAVLQRQLRGLPPGERGEADNLRLLIGLIAGAAGGVGRNELSQLLASGSDAEKQRIALQLLAQASREGAAKADFARQITDLIAAPRPHRILEDLLAMRAQGALEAANYAQAEGDAKALLEKFPGSQLKAQALGVLTSAAWERGYYRNAADFAMKARDALRPEDRQTRANLGLLIAEAYFRAEDYRNAAEAYGAVLKELPEGVAAGELMFQQIQAEIRDAGLDATRLRAIEALLDGLVRNPAFDAVNRWKAEWNYAQALLAAGQAGTAAARVNQLLASSSPRAAGPGDTLPAEVRARMEWLRARLSLEAGEPEQALRFADELGAPREGVNPALQQEIASSMALLRAQADFALGREAAAADVLRKLRADFPGSNSPGSKAAINSYFVEANYNARQDKIAVAQQLLNKVADDFPQSEYAADALYQVALLEESRGQEANLKEANSRFEKLIAAYPRSEWVFGARYQQGEILRRLNEFPPAQSAYELIINEFPHHPGVEEVRLALADTHAAQAAGDESHADRAKEGYDRLLALPTAPIDLRVEAGFKLGNLLLQHPDTRRVEDVWWRDVVDQFLISKPELAAQLGVGGRYWMSRTLLELGDLFQRQDRPDQARRTWELIRQKGLPGRSEAEEKLGVRPPDRAP